VEQSGDGGNTRLVDRGRGTHQKGIRSRWSKKDEGRKEWTQDSRARKKESESPTARDKMESIKRKKKERNMPAYRGRRPTC